MPAGDNKLWHGAVLPTLLGFFLIIAGIPVNYNAALDPPPDNALESRSGIYQHQGLALSALGVFFMSPFLMRKWRLFF